MATLRLPRAEKSLLSECLGRFRAIHLTHAAHIPLTAYLNIGRFAAVREYSLAGCHQWRLASISSLLPEMPRQRRDQLVVSRAHAGRESPPAALPQLLIPQHPTLPVCRRPRPARSLTELDFFTQGSSRGGLSLLPPPRPLRRLEHRSASSNITQVVAQLPQRTAAVARDGRLESIACQGYPAFLTKAMSGRFGCRDGADAMPGRLAPLPARHDFGRRNRRTGQEPEVGAVFSAFCAGFLRRNTSRTSMAQPASGSTAARNPCRPHGQ